MAEPNKKKPRKSKIELRQCIDVEDFKDPYEETQMQDPALKHQQEALKLLPKLKNAIALDNENDDTSQTQPNVQFSVQIEVESFDDENIQNEENEEIDVDSIVPRLPSHEVIISNEDIIKEVDKLAASENYIDRKLTAFFRNAWGKNVVKHVDNYHDSLINAVLCEWRHWNIQSKLREGIMAYKCNICSIGWWELGPFREHIRIHAQLSLNLTSCNQESCVVAAQGQWFESMCLCKIEGPCPKCLYTYEEHTAKKRGTVLYYCDGCNDYFTTCLNLFRHEGECIRFEKLIFQNGIPTMESLFRCNVCSVSCITQDRYDNHLTYFHSVRSDQPMQSPLLKDCMACDMKYIIYYMHSCPKKADKYKCSYCNRKFQNKILVRIHEKLTKSDVYCKICRSYLEKQCMEEDHLLTHSKNYVQVYKCMDCLDNVLLADRRALVKHKTACHERKEHKRRGNHEFMIVPRCCMIGDRSQGVTVEEMIIDRDAEKSLIRNRATVNIGYVKDPHDTLQDIIKKRKQCEELNNANKQKMNQLCTDLKNRMLKRALVNPSKVTVDPWAGSGSNSLLKHVNNELESAVSSIEDVKEEIEESQEDDDEMFNEMQNSVDALINRSKIKEDIEIEETKWDEIVIDDSQDCDDFDGNNEENVEVNKESEVQEESDVLVDFAIVKNEPDTNETVSEVNDKDHKESKEGGTSDVEVDDDVIIKDEIQEIIEIDDDIDSDIEKTHEACMEELSKVFSASKDAKSIELSGISMIEDVSIKEEPIDDYEEDIIMLRLDNPSSFDVTVTAENVKLENANEITSEPSKEINPDMDLSQFEPDINIQQESGDKCERIKKNAATGKLYRCKKCHFIAEHRSYAAHKRKCRKKRTKLPKVIDVKQTILWKKIKCTKCNMQFPDLNKYFLHFTKHTSKLNGCPCCPIDSKRHIHLKKYTGESHLVWHIKNSFVKIQLLNESTCMTSKNTGLFQCKNCSDKVAFENFFEHWEKHLKFNEEDEEKNLVVDEGPSAKPREYCKNIMMPEEIRKVLKQLDPAETEKQKRCCVCGREFDRRNDCKRHMIEHLLRDAYSRRPAIVCQMCNEQFKKPDMYRNHMRCHAGLPMFKCEMCDKCFSDSSNFAKHKKVHNVHVFSTCAICNKKFQSKTGLLNHMEMHRTTQPKKCPKCSKTFYSVSSYNKHVKTVHDKPPMAKSCHLCAAKFSSLKNFWDHMWDVHQERRMKADCPLCNKSFRKLQDVKSHLREDHKKTSEEVRQRSKRARPVKDNKIILKKKFQLNADGQEQMLVVYDNEDIENS